MYSFKNVFYLDYEPSKSEIQLLIDFINKKDNGLIIFDYSEVYKLILPYVKKTKTINWVYKNNLSTISDCFSRDIFKNILEFYDRNIIDNIICLDNSTYEVLKNSGYKVKYLKLDVNSRLEKAKNSKTIGLIGNDYNPNNNIYNELSAVRMIDYSYVKLLKSMPITKHFIKFFDIKAKEFNNLDEVIMNNDINLYCNFTFNNFELILKSMDMGIPCLLGNTDFFDNNKILKEYLVLESDDDIEEIANRINLVRENKKLILKEYKKFRVDYSKEAAALLKKIN